jgi:acyl-CoA thioester hydrolase
MPKIFSYSFNIPDTATDLNGHVNNVMYVQWMQDVATLHSDRQGCTYDSCREIGAAWVVRAHQIEYLRPAFAGEEIEVLTWVCNFKRSRSLRRYRFLRCSDQALLARAETDWVFINTETGRPISIPQQVSSCYELVEPGDEPE